LALLIEADTAANAPFGCVMATARLLKLGRHPFDRYQGSLCGFLKQPIESSANADIC
jgi:hypothetical protein